MPSTGGSCPCCLSSLSDFGSAVVLGHVPVRYFRCTGCGFVCTEEPSWLEEAYATAIAGDDTGLLSRCFKLASMTEGIVRTLPPGGRYLDWGGGYGVLTRLLRDRGLDFRHYDSYAPNHFAKGFEGDLSETWDLITVYEVLEHLTDPINEVSRLASAAPILLFTTLLLPDPVPPPGTWWYYSLETGQHVSFYSQASLRALADRLGLRLASDGSGLHAFYRPGQLPRLVPILMRRPRFAHLLGVLLRRIRAHDG